MINYDLSTYNAKFTEEEKRVIFPLKSAKLNKMLGGGLRTARLYYIQMMGGRGKSSIMRKLFLDIVTSGQKAAYITTEENQKETVSLLACQYNGIDHKRWEDENRDEDCELMNKFVQEYKDNMFIYYNENLWDTSPGMVTVSTDLNVAEAPYLKVALQQIVWQGIKYVFLDYLGAISSDKQDNQYKFLTDLAGYLSNFAQDNNIMIFTAMQCNRQFPLELCKLGLTPEKDFVRLDQNYLQDSIGPYYKTSFAMTIFKYEGKDYINIYKNRFCGMDGMGCIRVVIDPVTHEIRDPDPWE